MHLHRLILSGQKIKYGFDPGWCPVPDVTEGVDDQILMEGDGSNVNGLRILAFIVSFVGPNVNGLSRGNYRISPGHAPLPLLGK
jgi:hypothetical protein